MIWIKAENYNLCNYDNVKAFYYNGNKKVLNRAHNRFVIDCKITGTRKVSLYKRREELLNSQLNKTDFSFRAINHNPKMFLMFDRYAENYCYVSIGTASKITGIYF